MAAKIEITIDGNAVSVEKDSFLLKAIENLGIKLPTLCNHKDLTPAGVCRLCVCEVDVRGKKKLVTSCNYPVRENITVQTASDTVVRHRKVVAEMYLGRWPNVPIIQKMAKMSGVTESRFQSDLTDENLKACVLCGRCVRGCREFAQEKSLILPARGSNVMSVCRFPWWIPTVSDAPHVPMSVPPVRVRSSMISMIPKIPR